MTPVVHNKACTLNKCVFTILHSADEVSHHSVQFLVVDAQFSVGPLGHRLQAGVVLPQNFLALANCLLERVLVLLSQLAFEVQC